MKIVKLLTILLVFASFSLSAQDIATHALGVRLGDSDGFGAEISYQKSVGRFNRFELDMGFRDGRNFDAFKAALVFQRVNEIDRSFNWYYGAGLGGGSVDFTYPADEGLFVFVAGDVGVECNFESLPLLISLDCRPEIGLKGYSGFSNRFDFDVALGIRYQF